MEEKWRFGNLLWRKPAEEEGVRRCMSRKKSNNVMLIRNLPEHGLLEGHKGRIVKSYPKRKSVKVIFPFASKPDVEVTLQPEDFKKAF
jgi:hypothetical protein